ncbi:hypothetical protein ZIOFF_029093 [Zingiber officinale]|uniref:C2H2-type domain-containing protein n=2 Tax=Zingiber officinale TaxID=94328 RepID=A0A8J5GX25_ZINOF|nr:hypothetical protein ZIOFF_029093 [Zingiber officinale]
MHLNSFLLNIREVVLDPADGGNSALLPAGARTFLPTGKRFSPGVGERREGQKLPRLGGPFGLSETSDVVGDADYWLRLHRSRRRHPREPPDRLEDDSPQRKPAPAKHRGGEQSKADGYAMDAILEQIRVWAAAKGERAMPALTCNACNKEFDDEVQQKLHYRSEWHRYNLKRKVAGVPGVTEELFQARQFALAEENSKLSATPMLYGCALCGKDYRSSKAHAQHLKSRAHAMKTLENVGPSATVITTVKPYAARTLNKTTRMAQVIGENEDDDESEDEWEEVNPNDMAVASESLSFLHVEDGKVADDDEQDDAIDEELDTSCCFICDQKYESIESCMVHMHKQHGFFIPDIEYLEDPEGLLTYVGLKVKRDFACLYCSDRCFSFQSLEAVRKHMIAKGHCKLRYGDGGDDEDVDLEDFYDYSSSYADVDGDQLMSVENMENSVELGSGGAELIIKQKTETGVLVRTLGSREFLRYYRQKPRPSPTREIALALSLATRYRSMGLATVHSKESIVRMKVIREVNRRGVEAMRSKIGMRSNVIRNLPKNVPY